jgi:hypothetical protein
MPKGVYEREEALPLTDTDRQYAALLLEWSRTLEEHKLSWESFKELKGW